MNTWSKDQLEAEWRYRLLERLGILCGDGMPTEEELKIARDEANEAIAALKAQE